MNEQFPCGHDNVHGNQRRRAGGGYECHACAVGRARNRHPLAKRSKPRRRSVSITAEAYVMLLKLARLPDLASAAYARDYSQYGSASGLMEHKIRELARVWGVTATDEEIMKAAKIEPPRRGEDTPASGYFTF